MAKGPTQQRRADPVDDGAPQAPLQGELIDPGGNRRGPPAIAQPIEPESLAIGLTRAEVDQQIATAKKYPRSLTEVKRRIEELATLDKETANEMIYARPQAGDVIRGASVRFAEIVAAMWGNLRIAARTVHEDKTFVESEGIVHDLETNVATVKRVRRRIIKRDGSRYPPDQIIVTANAAASIALRNAILAAVPKPLWRSAYLKVEDLLKGDAKTLVERRRAMLEFLKGKGIDAKRVYATLGIAGEADITLDHLLTLHGLAAALKNGEGSVDELFPLPEKAGAEKVSAGSKIGSTEPKGDGAQGFSKGHVEKELGGDKKASASAAKKENPKPDAPAKEETPHDPKTGEVLEEEAAESTGDEAGEATGEEETVVDSETEAEAETETEAAEAEEAVEEEETPAAEDEGPVSPIRAFLQKVGQTDNWNAIKGALGGPDGLYAMDDFKALDPEDQAAIRATIWERVQKLIDEGKEKLDFVTDPTAFRLWIEATDDPDAVIGNLAALERAPKFEALPEASKESMRAVVNKRVAAMRGGQ